MGIQWEYILFQKFHQADFQAAVSDLRKEEMVMMYHLKI